MILEMDGKNINVYSMMMIMFGFLELSSGMDDLSHLCFAWD